MCFLLCAVHVLFHIGVFVLFICASCVCVCTCLCISLLAFVLFLKGVFVFIVHVRACSSGLLVVSVGLYVQSELFATCLATQWGT